MNDIEEEWKDVIGFEGLYQVSNLGRIKSLPRTTIRRNGSPSPVPAKIMKFSNCGGYYIVNLSKQGKKKITKVHTIIGKAFVDNPENHPIIRHLNDIKTDNRLENLVWGTQKDNMADAERNGTARAKGSSNGNAVLNEEKVKKIKELIPHKTQATIARMFNVSRENIKDIKLGKIWKNV